MIRLMLHNNCDELARYIKKTKHDFVINLLSLPLNEDEIELTRKDITNPLSLGKKKYNSKTLHIAPFIHVYELISFVNTNIMYFSDVTISGFISETILPDDSIEKYYRDMKIISKYVLRENMFYNDDGNIQIYNGRL